MPFVDGKWVQEDDSVQTQLTGLLDTDSKYLTQARSAGERVASRRGLQNSSIAAGSSEAAAIAAAAPIASQDASQIATKNQTALQGDINLTNSTTLQGQQDEAALARQLSSQGSQAELQRIDNEAALIRQREQIDGQLTAQDRDALSALERQREAIASSDRQALLSAETSIGNNRISAASNTDSNYLNALSNLLSNPNISATDRNNYIAEFQRVRTQSAALVNSISGIPMVWGGSTVGGAAPAPTTAAPANDAAQPATATPAAIAPSPTPDPVASAPSPTPTSPTGPILTASQPQSTALVGPGEPRPITSGLLASQGGSIPYGDSGISGGPAAIDPAELEKLGLVYRNGTWQQAA